MTATEPTVRVGDTLRLVDDLFHTVTTEGELGFAQWLVSNGQAEVVTNDESR